mmetsp:Transcript_56469/g.163747  ORF Transcript_56469/g.163747 Transcript_56469/m.163747 type:complete len:233 (-) Transcript_56469:141-839(-)
MGVDGHSAAAASLGRPGGAPAHAHHQGGFRPNQVLGPQRCANPLRLLDRARAVAQHPVPRPGHELPRPGRRLGGRSRPRGGAGLARLPGRGKRGSAVWEALPSKIGLELEGMAPHRLAANLGGRGLALPPPPLRHGHRGLQPALPRGPAGATLPLLRPRDLRRAGRRHARRPRGRVAAGVPAGSARGGDGLHRLQRREAPELLFRHALLPLLQRVARLEPGPAPAAREEARG